MNINQIVKGKICGTFIILGFRTINGIEHAQLKTVNPDNYTEFYPGELALPLDSIMEI